MAVERTLLMSKSAFHRSRLLFEVGFKPADHVAEAFDAAVGAASAGEAVGFFREEDQLGVHAEFA